MMILALVIIVACNGGIAFAFGSIAAGDGRWGEAAMYGAAALTSLVAARSVAKPLAAGEKLTGPG